MKDLAKISVQYILSHDQTYFSPDFKLTIAGRRGHTSPKIKKLNLFSVGLELAPLIPKFA